MHIHIYIEFSVCLYKRVCTRRAQAKLKKMKTECGKCHYEFGCQKLSGPTKLVSKSKR